MKDKYYKKFIKLKDPFWYNKYKTYRNSINHLIKVSKNKYYKNYFKSFNSNSKKVWAGIKSIISNKKTSQTSINLQIDGEIITDQETVTNKFNTFFVNIGPNLIKQIPPSNSLFTDYLKNPNQNSMFLAPTTPNSARNNVQKFGGQLDWSNVNLAGHVVNLGGQLFLKKIVFP